LVDSEARDDALFPMRAGERLRAARIKAGLDMGDIATRTRVPLRRLEAIERGDMDDIPSPTYAVGFAKSFARAVGEDPDEIARILRDELGQTQPEQRGRDLAEVEDFDPQRVPSRTLAWTALAIVLLIVGGYAAWRGWLTRDPAAPAPKVEVADVAAPKAVTPDAAPAPNPTGQVVLTAKEAVWLRIYDAADKVLFEKEMTAGERYEVPADANNPMIRTGRADLLSVTVGGREVAALGPAERTVKDVGVSAAALTARPPAAAPMPAPSPISGTAIGNLSTPSPAPAP
jgi:cytoskeleton protein RodZ